MRVERRREAGALFLLFSLSAVRTFTALRGTRDDASLSRARLRRAGRGHVYSRRRPRGAIVLAGTPGFSGPGGVSPTLAALPRREAPTRSRRPGAEGRRSRRPAAVTARPSFCLCTDPRTGVALGIESPGPQCAFETSMFMCPAVHTTTRILLRPSSTHEPSDPPFRVVFLFRSASFYTGGGTPGVRLHVLAFWPERLSRGRASGTGPLFCSPGAPATFGLFFFFLPAQQDGPAGDRNSRPALPRRAVTRPDGGFYFLPGETDRAACISLGARRPPRLFCHKTITGRAFRLSHFSETRVSFSLVRPSPALHARLPRARASAAAARFRSALVLLLFCRGRRPRFRDLGRTDAGPPGPLAVRETRPFGRAANLARLTCTTHAVETRRPRVRSLKQGSWSSRDRRGPNFRGAGGFGRGAPAAPFSCGRFPAPRRIAERGLCLSLSLFLAPATLRSVRSVLFFACRRIIGGRRALRAGSDRYYLYQGRRPSTGEAPLRQFLRWIRVDSAYHPCFRLLMILPQVHLRKPCYDFYFL